MALCPLVNMQTALCATAYTQERQGREFARRGRRGNTELARKLIRKLACVMHCAPLLHALTLILPGESPCTMHKSTSAADTRICRENTVSLSPEI